jgi:hypothetical protein
MGVLNKLALRGGHGRGGGVSLNPPVNVELPEITGDLEVDGVLTTSDGIWNFEPSGYTYQWLADGEPILGATSNPYSVTEDDVGVLISVTVTAVNADGETEATSDEVGPVAGVEPANTVAPTILGGSTPPLAGETLTAFEGTWTGTPAPVFTYQWKSDGVNIGGATNRTFLLTVNQEDELVTVVVTGTNSTDFASATSAAVGPVVVGPDVTAPTLSALTASPLTTTAATFEVTTNEGGGVLHYVVVPTAAVAPSAAQIVAGTDGDDVAATYANTFEVAGITTYGPEIIRPLGAGDTYDIYLVHYDDEDNASNVVTDEFTQAGGFVPILSGFEVIDYDDDYIRLKVSTDTANGNFYAVVVPTAAVAPSVVQIEAGTDGSGNAATATASLAIGAAGFNYIELSGLTGATTYDVYLFHEAGSGGDSAIETTEFTTDTLIIARAADGTATGLTAGIGCAAILTAQSDSEGGSNAVAVEDTNDSISGNFILSVSVGTYIAGTVKFRCRYKLVAGDANATYARLRPVNTTVAPFTHINIGGEAPGIVSQGWNDDEFIIDRDNGFFEMVGTFQMSGADLAGSFSMSFANSDNDLTLLRDGTRTIAVHKFKLTSVA